jgi:ABC-type methionine transport system ATPase subunit
MHRAGVLRAGRRAGDQPGWPVVCVRIVRGDSFWNFANSRQAARRRKPFIISCQRNRRALHRNVTDPIFQVEHLSLTYPEHAGRAAAPILNDVSFSIERGRALTLVGPSGSGKSTLLRCLNRLVEPTSGTVSFDGRDVRTLDPRELRRRVALVMQTPVLFEGTVRENLRVRPAGAPGDFSEPRLRSALAEVGLEPDRLEQDASTLSGGEKQRVTIARALLRDPQVLLLDEPTSALDPPNALLVVATIARLRKARGLSIVAVTHQPDLVRRLGGSLLYLVKGRVQAFESEVPASTDARLHAFLAGEPAAVTEPPS